MNLQKVYSVLSVIFLLGAFASMVLLLVTEISSDVLFPAALGCLMLSSIVNALRRIDRAKSK